MSVFSRTREGSQASTREALIDLAYLVSQVCDSNGSLLRNEIMSVSAPPEPGGAQGIEYLRNFNTQAWQVLESDVPSAERLEGLSDLGGISSMLSREAGLSVESRNAGSYVEFIISGQDLPPSLVTRLQDDLLEAFSGPTLGGAERMSPYYLVGSSGIIAEPGNMAAYQLFGVVAAVLILATFRALVDGKSAPSSVSGISGKAS